MNVDEFIDRLTPRLTHVMGERVHLTIITAGPAGTVRASWEQLERILLNLMFNASATTRDGGRVRVETSASDYVIDGGDGASTIQRHVRLTVRDNGRGIPAQVQQQLIESTSTAADGGFGLGFESVAKTVRQLGGHLHVESDEGAGTSVHVDLPLQ